MDWTCLLVDFSASSLDTTWLEESTKHDFGTKVYYTKNLEEARIILGSGKVLTMIVFAKQNSGEIAALLREFQIQVGCLPEFQAIVCNDPPPTLMAGVFDFGIDKFIAVSHWAKNAAAVTQNALALVQDGESAEAKTIALTRAIRAADWKTLRRTARELGALSSSDYRAAHAKGKAAEAAGDYDEAASAYREARSMNKMFRPAAVSLGEALIITGNFDAAIEIFTLLNKTNPSDVARKCDLASAYIAKGDMEKARAFIDAASQLVPPGVTPDPRLAEVKVEILAATGDINGTLALMDSVSEAGAVFADRLNESAIKLAQSGKGDQALAIYEKAHGIVLQELRYKISLNAAMACWRLRDWAKASEYATRCEQEHGTSFYKLEKLKEAIQRGQREAQGQVAPSKTRNAG